MIKNEVAVTNAGPNIMKNEIVDADAHIDIKIFSVLDMDPDMNMQLIEIANITFLNSAINILRMIVP